MHAFLQRVRTIFSVDTSDPDLMRAQVDTLSLQMPLMYAILLTSSWGLSYTHYNYAPYWLTIVIPGIFSIVGIIRSIDWYRYRKRESSLGEVRRRLLSVKRLSYPLAIVFTGWSLTIFEYGGAYERAHVAFYMSITVIACIFCLSALPASARIVTILVNGSFVLFFIDKNIEFFSAMSVNVFLVCIGMLVVLEINFKNFSGNILEKKKSDALVKENTRLAYIDSLTGLPNRRAFYAELEKQYARANECNARVAVGLLDLDGFKPVNDLYGHHIGDRLLKAVSDRMKAFQESDPTLMAFRLGGDEFACIVPDAVIAEEAQKRGDEFCTLISAPYDIEDITIKISGTVGVAVYPETGSSPQDLFERADHALYRGKNTKRGSCTIFSSDHDVELHREARIVQALKSPDLENQLKVVFQPIVDIHENRTIGFEALARWTCPNLGFVSPDEFIPIAEQSGLINEITRINLEKALAEAVYWPNDLRLSFNLSAIDLSGDDNLLRLMAVLRRSGVDPKRIDFEVTETAFARDFEKVHSGITLLRTLGCGISLDDFGTGYSSLGRLHHLPLSKIKIDRSFVTGMEVGNASYKIVRSLLVLSRDMQLECVVEGVETECELNILRELGVRAVQGYFFSPPVDAAKVSGLLDFNQSRNCAAS